RRTLLTLLPTALGLAALLFLWAVNEALQTNMTENFQRYLVGSLQIHGQGFFRHPRLQNHLEDAQEVARTVAASGIEDWTPRLESFVLAAGTESSTGMMLIAIDPSQETRVTNLALQIGQGRFFQREDEYVCLIGAGAARNLGVATGDSLDLIANDRFGAPVGDRFRVVGILEGAGYGVDRDIVFVPLTAAQEMLDMEGRITNLVLWVPERRAPEVTRHLRDSLDEQKYEVLRWNEMFPIMHEWVQVHSGFEYFFSGVVLLLVAAAVGNVALVASLNRQREFGIMLAIGTTGIRLRRLLLLESVLLSTLGTIGGLLIGLLVIRLTEMTGIDLSAFLGDTQRYYVDPALRPRLTATPVLLISSAVFAFSLLAGAHPAVRAGRLQPLEALAPRG
ncbi:MAG: ABC transporter permease, partial [Pseudomonadota bacterium]